MKQKTLLVIAFFLMSLFSVEAFGQAKKPRLVVIPSDALLLQMHLLGGTDDMGEVNYVQNYKQAFLDTELKACIAKISELFQDDGFALTMLEAELRRVQGKNLTIPVDVRLELNYKINKKGPQDVLYFELTGLDAYSSKQIAGASGQSKPAVGATKVELLQEAVNDKFRKFSDDIMNYFTELGNTGRESRLTIETDGCELPSQVEDIVDLWLQRNCVNGSFSIDEVDDTSLRASQAMMPLYNANNRGMDARNFYRPLVQELQSKLSGFTVKQSSSSKTSGADGGGTLGDAYILISQ